VSDLPSVTRYCSIIQNPVSSSRFATDNNGFNPSVSVTKVLRIFRNSSVSILTPTNIILLFQNTKFNLSFL